MNPGSAGNENVVSPLDYAGYDSMYCGRNGAFHEGSRYWLGTLGDGWSQPNCIYADDGRISSNVYSSAMGICPLVALNSDFVIKIEKP